MQFNLNKKHKIILTVLALMIFAVFGFVSWAGSKAASYVKEQVARQTFIKGTLDIDDVGAALSGDVWVSNITWYDPDGKLVAKIPRLNISVRLNDIFGGGLTASSIELITLERPELYLIYSDKEGLNVTNLILIEPKTQTEVRPGGDKQPNKFRGAFAIEKGLLQIESGENRLIYESFDSKLEYKAFPKVTGMVQAKQNNADFAGILEITYTEEGEVVKLDAEGRSILLTDFFDMVPVESNLKVTAGNISTIKIDLELVPEQPAKIHVRGAFNNLEAESKEIKIDSFKGEFNGNEAEIVFTDIEGKVNAQPVQINGKVLLAEEAYKLDLKVESAAFKLSALSPGITITDPFSFDADIKGVTDNPLVQGQFSAALIKTDQLELVNTNGRFEYAEGIVGLHDTSAGVYGGRVTANGTIQLAEESFKFNIHGSGISAKAMTSTNLNGPLAFTAYATGAGDPDSAAVNGNFEIGKGDFSGFPFTSMTGNFAKHGSIMSVSNITLNTLAGSLSVNATVQSDGKIRFDDIDAAKFSQANLQESLQEKAREEVEKGKDKLANALKKIF